MYNITSLRYKYSCLIPGLLFLAVYFSLAGVAGATPMTTANPYSTEYILQNTFSRSLIYSNIIKEYKADLYLKGNLHIHKQNRIIKYLPSMFRLEKGVKDYIHESISELHYTAPRIFERKIRAVSTTCTSDYNQFFDIVDFISSTPYAPSDLGDKLLFPINRQSRIHYRYQIDSIDYRPGGELYKIRFTPRYHSTQLITGFFWVSSADWTIKLIQFTGAYDLTRFRVSMQMGKNEEDKLLPTLFNLDLNFRFLGNHMEMNYTGWLNYNEVMLKDSTALAADSLRRRTRKSKELNLSRSYVLTCDTSRLIQDRDSFARIRPLPLTDKEDSLYLQAVRRKDERAKDTLRLPATRLKKNLTYIGQIGDALISSYHIDMSKVGSINCSPLINPLLVSYSHRNGFSYKQKFKYNKLFHDGKLLHLTPQIGYNFTRKELYAMLDGEYVYNPLRHGSINLSVGNGNRIYSSVVLDKLKAMNDSTFSFDNLQLDYFKDIYLNLSHNMEVINGLNFWIGVSMHWRHMANRNHEVASRVRVKYNSFAPRIRLEWTPGMYYYLNGNRKINVGSRYPTFVFDYERGLHIMKHSGKHERFEMSAEQRIRIRNLHTIAYHLGGGFFTNQENMYFVDYVDFANRNLPQGWNDDIGGTFQLLDGRWYNASRHYVRGNMSYETPFLFLYPVSRLLSFIQKERIYGGILFMPYLHPYFEIGYGVGTHLFDMGIFAGNENGKFTSVGFKFTFELFNK